MKLKYLKLLSIIGLALLMTGVNIFLIFNRIHGLIIMGISLVLGLILFKLKVEE